jgi:hypothetical protein
MTYFLLYISSVAITYVLYVNLHRIKSYKSDIARCVYERESVMSGLSLLRSLLSPITLPGTLIDILYFFLFESKESFDSGVVKIMVKREGKECTRQRLKCFFDVMPHYIEKQLR